MSERNDPVRAERLKAALRENLRRRKVQVRGRADPDTNRTPSERDTDRPDPRGASAPEES